MLKNNESTASKLVWSSLAHPTRPSPRAGPSLAVLSNSQDTADGVEQDGRIVMFGGASVEEGPRDDTWTLATATWQWMPVHARGTRPPPRYEHFSCTVRRREKDGRQEVLVFGGSGNQLLNDLWLLDLDTLSWSKPQTKGSLPTPRTCRSSCALVWTVQRQCLWVWGGGADGDSPVNDLDWHCLDLDSMMWSTVTAEPRTPAHPHPAPRLGHSVSAFGSKLLVYGGQNGRDVYGDMWEFDTETRTWSQPATTGPAPLPRAGHASAVVHLAPSSPTTSTNPPLPSTPPTPYLLIHGGLVPLPPRVHGSVHLYDPSARTWRPLESVAGAAMGGKGGSEALAGRLDHGCVAVGGRKVVVWGGVDLGGVYAEGWLGSVE